MYGLGLWGYGYGVIVEGEFQERGFDFGRVFFCTNTLANTRIHLCIFITTSGSEVKTVNGEECRDVIEPSRNELNKQGCLPPTSGIETQNGHETYRQQKHVREDSKQCDDDEMCVSSPQNQEDGMTSDRMQETTTPPPKHQLSGDLSSKGASKGDEDSRAPVLAGNTSRFFGSLFGAKEKAASNMALNTQNSNQVKCV